MEYGSKRLGGLYLRFDEARRAIHLIGPLLPRELLCSTFGIRFVAAFLKQQPLAGRCERIEVLIPRNLLALLEPILLGAGAAREDDLPAKLGMQPTNCVGYSFVIADLVKSFS